MEEISKNIGIKVRLPSKKCNDNACPFHGRLKCRGRVFTAIVVSTKMQKTVVVEFRRQYYLPKYERYEKRRTKIKAHNPECINAREGDIVKISECRPLSKTKSFVVVENLGKEKGFEEKREALEESKTRKKEREEEDAGSKSKGD